MALDSTNENGAVLVERILRKHQFQFGFKIYAAIGRMTPESFATRTNCHRKGESVGRAAFRRRVADGDDRVGRATRKVVNDSAFESVFGNGGDLGEGLAGGELNLVVLVGQCEL